MVITAQMETRLATYGICERHILGHDLYKFSLFIKSLSYKKLKNELSYWPWSVKVCTLPSMF